MAKSWRCYFALLTIVPVFARAGREPFPARLECEELDAVARAGGKGDARTQEDGTSVRLSLGSRNGAVWGALALGSGAGAGAGGWAPLPLSCVAVEEDRRRTDELRARCGAELPERATKIEVEVFQGGFLQTWSARTSAPGLLDAFLLCAPVAAPGEGGAGDSASD